MNIEVQKMIAVGGLDGYAKAIIEFLKSERLYNPEVNVINPDPKDYSPDYVFPRDFMLCSYSADNLPTESELKEYLEQANGQFSAVAGMDETDMTRISLIPADTKNLAMRAVCHLTEEEMEMSKNDRLQLEWSRKKEAFSVINKVAEDIYSGIK